MIVSTWVGNLINHGLYHALIPIFGIPFLNATPNHEMKIRATALIMVKEVVTLPHISTPKQIRDVLSGTYLSPARAC